MNVLAVWFALMDNPHNADVYRQNPREFIRAFWRAVRVLQRVEVGDAE